MNRRNLIIIVLILLAVVLLLATIGPSIHLGSSSTNSLAPLRT